MPTPATTPAEHLHAAVSALLADATTYRRDGDASMARALECEASIVSAALAIITGGDVDAELADLRQAITDHPGL